jgi:cell division protein FtsZ
MPIEMIEDDTLQSFNGGTQIKVIGVGGGGGNAVNHMIRSGVQGVEFIVANTDAQALANSTCEKTIHLGESGLGAGGRPEKGRDLASNKEEEIRAAIQGANMLFVTAGMGGGTGTGAAPVIAKVAKEMGILTVGVVTKPFDWEGGRRMSNADNGIAELQENVDSLIVVLNEQLLQVYGDDITQEQAFAHANDVLRNAVGGIAEVINIHGLINVDFEDVRTVMSEKGKALLGTAHAAGPDRARIAAEQAVACPLLEGVNLQGARGILVLISAAKDALKLSESRTAMNTIRGHAAPDAHIIYGTAYDDNLGDNIRVTVVATGLAGAQARQPMRVLQGGAAQAVSAPMQAGLRTGTDNIPILTQSVGHAAPAGAMPQAGIGSLSMDANPVPSVWRTGRTMATEKVNALQSGGMDEIEIPAFLRKQAD